MIYAINRYSNSRKPASTDPSGPNYHANIEADTPEEALRLSKLPIGKFNVVNQETMTLTLAADGGAEIWVRPAMPGTKPSPPSQREE